MFRLDGGFLCDSRSCGSLIEHGVTVRLGFRLREVIDWLRQSKIIEPVNPLPCREINGLTAPPRAAPIFDFGFVEPVDASPSPLSQLSPTRRLVRHGRLDHLSAHAALMLAS
jgi:hypothetical protein